MRYRTPISAAGSRWLCCAITLILCAGCNTPLHRPMQNDHPRSLDQLYFEALAAEQNIPENTHTPHVPPLVTPNGDIIAGTAASHSEAVPSQPPVARVAHTGEARGRVVQAQGIAEPARGADSRVTEIFEDTDIREAIQALATQAGASVIVDEQVGGVTTAFIEDEPFELALRKVLLPLGLVYRVHEGQYLIGSTDPESALFPLLADTVEYYPRHMSPQELLPLLPEQLQSYVRLVEKRNLMLVEAPPDMASRIVGHLNRADRPVPQVVLEAIVCVYNPTQKFHFSSELRQSLNIGDEEVLNFGTLGLAATGVFSPIGLENAFSDFAKTSTFLRLLAQEGYITIRAAPRVMAKDGEKATISINRETFFALQPSNANLLFRQDVQKVDAGIVLDIVPVIRGDSVTVTIEKAEVSENVRPTDLTETLNAQFPVINRRQVSTTVHVLDGNTIVIGGLTQRQTVDRLSHVPYLHKIPFFGKLFERIEQEDETVDVAIFISPKIIRPVVVDEVLLDGEISTDEMGETYWPAQSVPHLLPPQPEVFSHPAPVESPAPTLPPVPNIAPAVPPASPPAVPSPTNTPGTVPPVDAGTEGAAPPATPPPASATEQPPAALEIRFSPASEVPAASASPTPMAEPQATAGAGELRFVMPRPASLDTGDDPPS
jgi:type IV pilus assembly protein PilQ